MRTSTAHVAAQRSFDQLTARVRDAGMLLVSCDMDGTMPSPRGDGDWLSALLERPTIIRNGLCQAAAKWNGSAEPVACEGVPGLWFIPMPVEQRRLRTGYDVVCVPCDTLLKAEQFRSLCQAASIDAEYTRGAFAAISPPTETDVRRLAVLLRGSWVDVRRCEDSERALEDVGRELAESYEEINLLYSITQNMTDVECPEHFLEVTCEELRQQLPYAWVAAVVQDELGDPTLRHGRVAVAGNPGRSIQCIRSLGRALLLRAEAGTSIVTSPGLDGGMPGLDGTVIARPIVRGGRIIGLLIAADKEGPDPDASSVDIKLVTAAASHMEIFLENAGLYEDLNAMFLGHAGVPDSIHRCKGQVHLRAFSTCGHADTTVGCGERLRCEYVAPDAYRWTRS